MQGKQTYRSSRSLLDDRTQLDELVAQFFLNPFVQTEPVFRALRSLLLDSRAGARKCPSSKTDNSKILLE